jgi:Tfp pilus assembly protein PilF
MRLTELSAAQAPSPTAPSPTAPGPAAPAPSDRFLRMLAQATEHEQAGRLDAAEALLRQILAEQAGRPGALTLMGVVAFRKGRLAEAADWVEQAIALAPTLAVGHSNLCEMYRALGRLDEALAAGLRAAALEPANPRSHHNLTVLHYHRLELEESIAAAERAIAIEPDHPGAHFGIAQASLLQGDFARGWEEYEWRFRVAGVPPPMPATDRPQWDGKPLERGQRLLLVADQGFGDVIQFARYIPWAAARCPEIALACRKELQPLFARQPGLQMFDRWEEQPDFAAYSTLSGLPRLAATRLATIPADIPYLHAEPDKIARWAARLKTLLPAGHRPIGIAWAGRPTHGNDRNRSAALADLAPLADLPGVALLSLQKGPGQQQAGGYWGQAPLVNLGPELRDYGDTMAVIEALDLLVTVDTSVAHLAGAMGKPVWIALPYAPDWRWLLGREDSPWYPSARLFRQSAARDWQPVMASIAREASGFLKLKGASPKKPRS